MPTNKKIVVLGASGFLGKHVVQQLLQDSTCTIIAGYNNTQPKDLHQAQLKWQAIDVLDIDVLLHITQGAHQVYHCANNVSFDGGDATTMYHNNVEGTANVVNACLANNVGKLLFVSSVGAIGRAGTNAIITEDTPWLYNDNVSVYGLSKYKAELEVWRGYAEGLPVVIVNPSIILGEGDWNKSSSALFKNAYKEFPFYSTGINGFVDVQDVAKACYLLINSDIVNQRYILTENNYSYQTILQTIATTMHKKPAKYATKRWMANLIWRYYAIRKLLTGKKPLLTKETVNTALSTNQYSNAKWLAAFPNFTFTPISKTIQRASGYYLAQGDNIRL